MAGGRLPPLAARSKVGKCPYPCESPTPPTSEPGTPHQHSGLDMDKESWKKVREIFSHICDQSPSFRANYLDMVCSADDQLRGQIETMLKAHDEVDSHESFQAPITDSQPPESIGEYHIEAELGRGGMGTVYRAHHAQYGSVALKLLSARYLKHEVARKRFIQEASLLEKINHPIVCRIYDTGVLQEHAYIAMEEISGRTLREVLSVHPLTFTDAVRIARELANGLAVAHHLGVVHRDIKPSNVVIDDQSEPHLIDFGIAKSLDTHLTATGELIGSPAYMSPEQCRGNTVDNKTDIWSLGVLLFEMLSGKPYFAGDSVGDIAKSILSDETNELPQYSGDGYSLTDVQLLIRHMLERDPTQRPVNMESVSRTLTRMLQLENR